MRSTALAVATAAALVAPASAQETAMPTPRELIAASQQRLDAARDELRARDVPLTPQAFADKLGDVPDGLNPYVEFKAAFDALGTIDSPAYELIDAFRWAGVPALPGEPPVEATALEEDPPTWDDVQHAVADHAAVFADFDGIDTKIRPAVDLVRADFDIDYANPDDGLFIMILLPDLNRSRHLANVLGWKLVADVEAGRHDEVVATARRMIGLADAVDAANGVLVGHLVGIGIEALAADRVQRVARHLDIGDGEHQASREDVEMLIGVLLNSEPDVAAWRRAYEGEVVFQQNTVDWLIEGRSSKKFSIGSLLGIAGEPFSSLVLRAAARDDGAIMARLALPMLDAAEPATWPAARERIDPIERNIERVYERKLRNPLASNLLPSLTRGVESNYRGRSDSNLAAAALAVRLYQADHDGELPPTLDALVPDYLPNVTADIFAADAPLQYDRDRGVLWSVGIDGSNDGGFSSDDRLRQNPDLSAKQVRELGVDDVVYLKPALTE